ncbi:DUF4347 domain-containing protein [Ferruginibacter albus]|uniref:DUF4347 domain-containing protein n=1 Tax=Ferruginibacter albus TaxID=2875540 RepID=UPI001CC65A7C|nr:DUF4347 domain-containing protein [Ferruginibacter albus]UAY53267.1 DUF4347 domain-containing protein [Ferruginibacter albus]
MKPNLTFSILVCLLLTSSVYAHNGKNSFHPKTIHSLSTSIKGNSYIDASVQQFPVVTEKRSNVFQLISHGRSGELLLDGKWRNAAMIAEFIRSHQLLSKKIKYLNIYGCEFAKGENGLAAVNYLKQHLGVAIAASDNITGKGGDWKLEVGNAINALSFPQYTDNLQCAGGGVIGGTGPNDDFDGDGICNNNDIDDDNDGVLDAVEAPSCYYTTTEAIVPSSISTSMTSTVNSVAVTAGADIPTMHDGTSTTVTASNHVITTGQAFSGINIYTIQYPTAVNLSSVSVTGSAASWGTGTTATLYGSNDGTTWTSLMSAALSTAVTTVPKTFTVNQNAAAYRYYKIQGTAGTGAAITNYEVAGTLNASTYIQSAHPKNTCTTDTDGDGITNDKDLDSDGDGCSDALEAGATNSTTANYTFTGTDANSNGLIDSKENGTSGTINYTSTYNTYAIYKFLSACADTDGDGIPDLTDIDDDNDGVLDATEAPSCYYTTTEAIVPTSIATSMTSTVNSVAVTTGADIPTMHDGTSTTVTASNHVITTGQAFSGVNIYTITYPTAVNLSSVSVTGSAASWGTGTSATLYGSNDSTTWTSLMSAALSTAVTTVPKTFTVNQNAAQYRYYKIQGTAGTGAAITNYEVAGTLNTSTYIQSTHPKNTCTTDTDGDGITNDKDLDSDGDGCSDALEAGATTSTTINYQFSGTDANGNGLVDSKENGTSSSINYGSTYNTYGIYKFLSICTDTDGDGIPDISDIDDDNDGIVDAVESPYCFYTQNESINLASSTVISDFAWNSSGPLTNTYDRDATTSGWVNPAVTNIAGLSLIDFIIPVQQPAIISNIQIEVGVTALSSSASALWRLEGWNGTAWEALSNTQAMNTVSTVYTFSNTLQPTTKYGRYRIAGTSTTAGVPANGRLNEVDINYNNYIPSANPKQICTDDIDGDGILNHLDLDSDGDGCPDLKEANVSPLTDIFTPSSTVNNAGISYGITAGNLANSQLNPNGTDTNNDGLNDSVDPGKDGTTDYTSTYNLYALDASKSGCLDTDGDGIIDLIDTDDDNDGVPDVAESQVCIVTGTPRAIMWDRESEKTKSADLAYFTSKPNVSMTAGVGTNIPGSASGSWNLQGLNNNGTLSDAIAKDDYQYATFTTGSTSLYVNSWLYYTLSPVINVGVLLDDDPTFSHPIILNDGATATTYTSTMMDGSGDPTHWKIISVNPTSLNPNTTYYVRFYDLTTNTSVTHDEIGLRFFADAQGLNCNTDIDTDNDGIPNRLDLDSDGDGCSDALESGATTNTTTNYQFSGMDANGNGLVDSKEIGTTGSINYTSTYNQYAVYNFLSTCTDTDGDGIPDLIDIDDDNDGILNATEAPSCYYTQAEASDIISVSSDLTFSAAKENAVDSNYATLATLATLTASQSITNKTVFMFVFNKPVQLTGLKDSLNSTASIFSATSLSYKIQATNDTLGTWTDVSTTLTTATATGNHIIWSGLTSSQPYKYYRIYGLGGTTTAGNTKEFIPTVSSTYVASSNPKNTCSVDTDNDGITNDKDLDSDGDGCPDAKEAGTYYRSGVTMSSGSVKNGSGGTVTSTVTLNNAVISNIVNGNGFADVLQAAADTNSYKYSYQPYTDSALVSSVSNCNSTGTVASAQTICGGNSPANLTISGYDGSIVKWQYSTDNFSSDVHDISSSASTTLTAAQMGALSANRYFRAVLQIGASTSNSSSVLITVNNVVGGSSSPNQSICPGSSVSDIAVSGYSGSISKWQYSIDNFSSDVHDISSSASATLTAAQIGEFTSTRYFRAVITNGSCTAYSSATTITVSSATEGGTAAASSQTICYGATPADITVTGYSTSIIKWQYSTDNFNLDIHDIPSSASATLTGAQIGTLTANRYFRLVVQGGTCTPAYSIPGLITVNNSTIWLGTTSSDWNTASNWSCNYVPLITSEVFIPNVGSNPYPILSSGAIGTTHNITMESVASLTIINNKLQIAGTISIDSDAIINAKAGTMELKGTASQTIGGHMFQDKTVKYLIITNTASSLTATALDTLKISYGLSFGNINSATFNTNDNLELLSDCNTVTAAVADITNNGVNSGNSIVGKVIVDRCIPEGRAWRLLTAPITNSNTIYESWQNHRVNETGKGTLITVPQPIPANSNMDTGITNLYSLKVFNTSTQALVNVLTTNQKISPTSNGSADNIGYYIFIRGDRNYDNVANPYLNSVPLHETILSSMGNLQQNNQVFTTPSGAGKYTLIGNPFASPIDFSKVTLNNVIRRFYAWDATINELGAYVAMDDIDGDGIYDKSISASHQDKNIQSGQAFLVQNMAAGTGTITFPENCKSTVDNILVFRPTGETPSIRIKLMLSNNDTTADETLAQFGNSFNAMVDWQDAPKFANANEGLSLLRNSKGLSIERRPFITSNDTLFVRLTGTVVRNYKFNIIPTNIQTGLTATLVDNYTNTTTPVDLVNGTDISFSVTSNAASTGNNRFMIVFRPAEVLPVSFTSVTASTINTGVTVSWKVENQLNIKNYVVERSADGKTFNDITTVTAESKTDYSAIDISAMKNDNFYRIKSIGNDGSIQYSSIVKVSATQSAGNISAYPNPMVGNTTGLQFSNMPKGKYLVKLVDGLGQTIASKEINHNGGTATETFSVSNLTKGVYQLQVLHPDKTITTISIMN